MPHAETPKKMSYPDLRKGRGITGIIAADEARKIAVYDHARSRAHHAQGKLQQTAQPTHPARIAKFTANHFTVLPR